MELMGLSIPKLGIGDIGEIGSGVNHGFGRYEVVFSQVPAHSLVINICLRLMGNSLPMIRKNLSPKVATVELLLLSKKVPILSGSGFVEGIQDITDTLRTCLTAERLMA
jgi:hypothetical protein